MSDQQVSETATLVRLLVDANIEFIVVGMSAAVFLGVPATTIDFDIVHRRTPDNIARLLALLASIEAHYRHDMAKRKLPPTAEALAGRGHQNLQTNHGPLDVLCQLDELGYDELIPRSIVVTDSSTVGRVARQALVDAFSAMCLARCPPRAPIPGSSTRTSSISSPVTRSTRNLRERAARAAEQAALWLLACCKREPAFAQMVEAINNGASDKIGIGFLERTFACDVQQMLAKGMVHVDEEDASRNRRGVQITRVVRDVLRPSTIVTSSTDASVDAAQLAISAETLEAARSAIRSHATIVAAGLGGLGRRTLLRAVATEIGLPVRSVDGRAIVGTDGEVRQQMRELALECRLAQRR